ncbi:hypothetical protein [Desulfosarcina ovata]|uniref:hypothetical protein n=1 Tax=Desulfosarcina ovata TaxID=83564 RepID=UPI0012D2FAEB|nr:hypothetical protein [Desulfosarcina ovata]
MKPRVVVFPVPIMAKNRYRRHRGYALVIGNKLPTFDHIVEQPKKSFCRVVELSTSARLALFGQVVKSAAKHSHLIAAYATDRHGIKHVFSPSFIFALNATLFPSRRSVNV